MTALTGVLLLYSVLVPYVVLAVALRRKRWIVAWLLGSLSGALVAFASATLLLLLVAL